MGRSAHERILEIDLTFDQSDDDIFDIDAVTYFRDGHQRAASAGHAVKASAQDGEGGTPQDINAGVDLASVEVWIVLGEQIPSPGVIVLDVATQS